MKHRKIREIVIEIEIRRVTKTHSARRRAAPPEPAEPAAAPDEKTGAARGPFPRLLPKHG